MATWLKFTLIINWTQLVLTLFVDTWYLMRYVCILAFISLSHLLVFIFAFTLVKKILKNAIDIC